MARKAPSKPADSTANLGFEATAVHVSAFLQSEASPQVVGAAEDNGGVYDPACGSGSNSFLFCAA